MDASQFLGLLVFLGIAGGAIAFWLLIFGLGHLNVWLERWKYRRRNPPKP